MQFDGIEDFNTYLGIIDGMTGTYDEFIELTYEEVIMPLEVFKLGNDSYLFGYLLGLEIVGRA